MFEDREGLEETANTAYVRYVCLVELKVLDLVTEGVGVWKEAYVKSGSKASLCCFLVNWDHGFYNI